MFLNGFDYLPLSDGWGPNGVDCFFPFRIFTASPYAKLEVAQPTPHFMVQVSCKKTGPIFKKKYFLKIHLPQDHNLKKGEGSKNKDSGKAVASPSHPFSLIFY